MMRSKSRTLFAVLVVSACGEENGERARSPEGSLVAVRDFRVGGAVDESGAERLARLIQ